MCPAATLLPAYVLPDHLPPPPPAPALTINAKGRAHLSKALLAALGLRAGQVVDLLPPTSADGTWHLDLRPEVGRRISWHESTGARLDGVHLPADLLAPGTRLTLTLASPQPTSPGCYALVASEPLS